MKRISRTPRVLVMVLMIAFALSVAPAAFAAGEERPSNHGSSESLGSILFTEAPVQTTREISAIPHRTSANAALPEATSQEAPSSDGDPSPLSSITVDSSTTTWTNGNTYSVDGTVTIATDRVRVSGNVTLQLNSGCVLTVQNGITVTGTDSLTIVGSGTLIAKGGSTQGAGIGGNTSLAPGGIITIQGGIIKATGGSLGGAGIGGGMGGTGGTITIQGGDVTATGGTAGAAGIGGGMSGAGGTITISGGTVEAKGTQESAGIGGGSQDGGGTITISGGIVRASGSQKAAGIGGGASGNGGAITISGGTVNAVGGNSGAGIGGGNGAGGGTIVISGGTVVTTGTGNGAGIGAGGSYAGASANSFSTTSAGNAFIDASSISDQRSKNQWRGVIFEGAQGSVYGTSVTLNTDATIPAGATLDIPEGTTLEVAKDSTLNNEGMITNEGAVIGGKRVVNNGTIKLEENAHWDEAPSGSGVFKAPAHLAIRILQNGSPIISAQHGTKIVLEATVTVSGSSILAESGTVDFYTGSADTPTKLNAAPIAVANGRATLSLDLEDADWPISDVPYTVLASYAGSTSTPQQLTSIPLSDASPSIAFKVTEQASVPERPDPPEQPDVPNAPAEGEEGSDSESGAAGTEPDDPNPKGADPISDLFSQTGDPVQDACITLSIIAIFAMIIAKVSMKNRRASSLVGAAHGKRPSVRSSQTSDKRPRASSTQRPSVKLSNSFRDPKA